MSHQRSLSSWQKTRRPSICISPFQTRSTWKCLFLVTFQLKYLYHEYLQRQETVQEQERIGQGANGWMLTILSFGTSTEAMLHGQSRSQRQIWSILIILQSPQKQQSNSTFSLLSLFVDFFCWSVLAIDHSCFTLSPDNIYSENILPEAEALSLEVSYWI